MKVRWVKRSGVAAMMLAALAVGAARAQTTPAVPDAGQTTGDSAETAKPKPKHAKPKVTKLPSVAVVVTNSRSVGLTELDAGLSGGDSVKVLGGLKPGKKAVVHLAHDKPCLFDVHGVFDDLTTTDMSSVNLCDDKKINLVE